ncbi:hypothetical protein AX14_003168 [Amanita brunnescens Koide BX004]|nr:hypothetical protein AX14_003168 [Amanita brunnescens Koide BX004]
MAVPADLGLVVVDEEGTPIDCIEVFRPSLDKLPLFQVKPINDKFHSFAKGARLAADVVQYKPAVERAVRHACGNALVCDTMEVA